MQGKEAEITLQAPDKPTIERMISETYRYAEKLGLEHPEVLSSGPDPDGGYKAIIVAHNVNVIKWLGKAKKKWEARGGGYQARMATAEWKKTERVQKLETQAKHAATISALKTREAKAKAAIRDARLKAIVERYEEAGETLGSSVATVGTTLAAPARTLRSARKAVRRTV